MSQTGSKLLRNPLQSAERSRVLGVGKGLTGTHMRISDISEIIFFFPQKRKETKASYKFHYTACKCVSTLFICLKKSGNTPASYKHIQFLSKGMRKIDTVGCRTWRKTGKRLESFFYLCHTEPHAHVTY